MRDVSDIIAAVATPSGRGGIGVVRVSGTDLNDFAVRLLGRVPPARHATVASFRSADGSLIDRGIVLRFEGPASYTGEDVLELQGHGGGAVLAALLERCLECGARAAEPGEFTRRAFLNDRIDLVQAEGVADLIDASSRAAARSAARSLSGEFSAQFAGLSEDIMRARVLVEACLDFPEEEIDAGTRTQVGAALAAIAGRIGGVRVAAHNGVLLKEGIHVALVGRPNVGKSSLLNRLVGEDLAIVTAIPGTTRDAVRGTIVIEGVPFHLVDTAGLRVTSDEVERIGQQRARTEAERADFVVVVEDSAMIGDGNLEPLDPALADLTRLVVWNKCDLSGAQPGWTEGGESLVVSAATGAGIDLLRTELLRRAGWRESEAGVFAARARHTEALEKAAASVGRALAVPDALELVAEELRSAHGALAHVTGEVTADDVLGEIFSKFCIGK